jgi:hypothetical protein
MASESLYKLVNRTCRHSQVLLLINESTKSLELDLTKSEYCGHSIISRPSGGGTPSASFRDGSAASGDGPWTALAGSAPLFGAPEVPPLPPPRPRSYLEWGLQGTHPSAGVFNSMLGSSSVSVAARAASGGSSVGDGPAQVMSSSAAGPPAPHSTGRCASRAEEVEVRSRGREESTPPLRLASDVGPSGSASSTRRSCSPGVDVQVVAQSLGVVALVSMVGSPPPLPLPSVVAPPQQPVVLRSSGPTPVLLSAVFAWLGGCLSRAPHATGLPAIEVVFPAADVPLRPLELPCLRDDRVTAEAPVVSPCLVVASALGSASISVSAASPGTLAVGRAAEFCSSVSRMPAPPVVLTRPKARRARPPPPDPSTLRRSGRIAAKTARGAPPPSPAGVTTRPGKYRTIA